MATRDPRLERLYAFKTKDLTSLRTYDIEGARPMKRTWERKNHNDYDPAYNYSKQDHADVALPSATHSNQEDRYVRGEEYRPLRNPLHYSDAKILKEDRHINLKPYYGGSNDRGQVGRSMEISEYSRKRFDDDMVR